MNNRYEFRGGTVAIFLDHKDGSHTETIIDAADFDLVQRSISGKVFRSTKTPCGGYALFSNGGKLHRLILGEPPNTLRDVPDHINRNSLDNRRSNLRWVTHQENIKNRRPEVMEKIKRCAQERGLWMKRARGIHIEMRGSRLRRLFRDTVLKHREDIENHVGAVCQFGNLNYRRLRADTSGNGG